MILYIPVLQLNGPSFPLLQSFFLLQSPSAYDPVCLQEISAEPFLASV